MEVKIPSSFIDRHGSVGQQTLNEILNTFKDCVTDAMIHGTRDEEGNGGGFLFISENKKGGSNG